MKNLLIFFAGLAIGALLLYGYLWYQVFHTFEQTWCQIYTGELSVEQAEKCERQ